MSEQYIKMLMDLGLTYQEAKIYFALCIRGAATVSELSDLAEVPYTKTYDVLSSLESKGLVVSLGGRPIRYKAVHPEIALRTLRENLESEYKRKIEKFDRIAKELKSKLTPIYEKVPVSRAEKLAIFLKGRIPINNMVIEMLSEAEPVYAILTTPTRRRLSRYIREHVEKLNFKILNMEDYEAECNIVSTRDKLLIFLSIPDDEELLAGHDIGILIDNRPISETFYQLLQTFAKEANESRVHSFLTHSRL